MLSLYLAMCEVFASAYMFHMPYMIYVHVLCYLLLSDPCTVFLLFVFGRSVARKALRWPSGEVPHRRLAERSRWTLDQGLAGRIEFFPWCLDFVSVYTHIWWGVGRCRMQISLCGHPAWDRRRYTRLRSQRVGFCCGNLSFENKYAMFSKLSYNVFSWTRVTI